MLANKQSIRAMFCTTCGVQIDSVAHYSTQLHGINTRRKLSGYSPLTDEEMNTTNYDDGFTIDLYHNHESSSSESVVENNTTKIARECLYCDEEESYKHYLNHNIGENQAGYLMDLRCYVCYERFTTQEQLLSHLERNKHRTAKTDGTHLYLENGSVLLPVRRRQAATSQNKLRIQLGLLKPFLQTNKNTRKIKKKKYRRHMRVYSRIWIKKYKNIIEQTKYNTTA